MKKFVFICILFLLIPFYVNAETRIVNYDFEVYNNRAYNLSTGVIYDNDSYVITGRIFLTSNTVDFTPDIYHHILMWDKNNNYLGYVNSSGTSLENDKYIGNVTNNLILYDNGNLLDNVKSIAFMTYKLYDDVNLYFNPSRNNYINDTFNLNYNNIFSEVLDSQVITSNTRHLQYFYNSGSINNGKLYITDNPNFIKSNYYIDNEVKNELVYDDQNNRYIHEEVTKINLWEYQNITEYGNNEIYQIFRFNNIVYNNLLKPYDDDYYQLVAPYDNLDLYNLYGGQNNGYYADVKEIRGNTIPKLIFTEQQIANLKVNDTLKNNVIDETTTPRIEENVGEVVFDGSESWILESETTNTIYFRFNPNMTNVANVTTYDNQKSNLLPYDKYTSTNDSEGFILANTIMRARVNKTRLSTPDLTGFKSYLSSNNLEVTYELAVKNPNTKVIEDSDVISMTTGFTNLDFAYVEKPVNSIMYNNTNEYTALLQDYIQFTDEIDNINNIGKFRVSANNTRIIVGFPKGTPLVDAQNALRGKTLTYQLSQPRIAQTTLESVVNPTVKSVGKNLFDGEWLQDKKINPDGTIDNLTGSYISENYIKVNPNQNIATNYYLLGVGSPSNPLYIGEYDINKNPITRTAFTNDTLTVGSNTHYILLYAYNPLSSPINANIQLEQGTTPTAYEPYTSSQITFNEELNRVGNIFDTITNENGVYTKTKRLSDKINLWEYEDIGLLNSLNNTYEFNFRDFLYENYLQVNYQVTPLINTFDYDNINDIKSFYTNDYELILKVDKSIIDNIMTRDIVNEITALKIYLQEINAQLVGELYKYANLEVDYTGGLELYPINTVFVNDDNNIIDYNILLNLYRWHDEKYIILNNLPIEDIMINHNDLIVKVDKLLFQNEAGFNNVEKFKSYLINNKSYTFLEYVVSNPKRKIIDNVTILNSSRLALPTPTDLNLNGIINLEVEGIFIQYILQDYIWLDYDSTRYTLTEAQEVLLGKDYIYQSTDLEYVNLAVELDELENNQILLETNNTIYLVGLKNQFYNEIEYNNLNFNMQLENRDKFTFYQPYNVNANLNTIPTYITDQYINSLQVGYYNYSTSLTENSFNNLIVSYTEEYTPYIKDDVDKNINDFLIEYGFDNEFTKTIFSVILLAFISLILFILRMNKPIIIFIVTILMIVLAYLTWLPIWLLLLVSMGIFAYFLISLKNR